MSTAVATPTRISRMRTPAGRDGQHFENEYFQYLTPESFTVLPPEAGQPNPSRAPEPYKLTPRKRHKNQSFSIIAEPGLSAPNSRAGSPTGRVSPFRGRGFNPTGSRHASPAPSPPPGGESPDDETILQHSKELTNQLRKSSIGRSQIPVLSSKKILSPQNSNLHARFSKSMVNIAPRNLVRKPPPSPRKSNLKSFVRLSPIIGSSPEAGSDQTSSPSRIPRSRSQPPSRITSPSRNTSREVSPQSPTKISTKSVFKNIPAKVETFNRIVSASKPKVPQKPRVYATRTNSVRKNVKIANNRSPRREMEDTETTDSEIVKDTAKNKTRLTVRRNSINRNNNSTFSKPKSVKTKNDYEKPSTSKNSTKKESNNNDKNRNESNNNDKNKNESINNDKSTVQNEKTNKTNKTNSQTFRKEDNGAKQNRTKKSDEINKSDEETTEDARDDDILSVTIDEIIGSQTTKIVSATAETVVKPLNIEAKLITKTETTTDNPTNSNSANSTTQQKNAINNNSSSATSNTIPTPANGSVVNTPTNNLSEHNLTPSLTPSLNASSESVNNLKHVSNSLTPSVNSLEMNPKNNFNNLTPLDSDKVSNKSLMDSGNVTKLSNSTSVTNSGKVKGRTVIVDEIKPIKITVRERSGDIEVQSGNVLPRSATNGVAERPLIPPSNHPQNSDSPPPEGATQTGPCSKIFSCCGKPKPTPGTADGSTVSGVHALGSEEGKKSPCWEKMCCRKNGRVGDVHASRFSCFPRMGGGKNEGSWAERRDSILSEPPKKQPFSLKRVLCAPFSKCKKKKPEEIVESRRPSMLSKKKSLSSTMQPPPEDTGPKLDASLVEHTSHMRGAIPILPIPLAWICLVLNIFIPGTGTILSGILCLCLGIPRFSPRDTAKARVGAFLIDIVVGISQCFTVLFCLVGWGWSIWWGVIMHKIAKKYKKIKKAEENAIEEVEDALPTVNINKATQQRDVEKGKS